MLGILNRKSYFGHGRLLKKKFVEGNSPRLFPSSHGLLDLYMYIDIGVYSVAKGRLGFEIMMPTESVNDTLSLN